jgi:hypothetical protein
MKYSTYNGVQYCDNKKYATGLFLSHTFYHYFLVVIFIVVPGFELRALQLLGGCSTPPTSFYHYFKLYSFYLFKKVSWLSHFTVPCYTSSSLIEQLTWTVRVCASALHRGSHSENRLTKQFSKHVTIIQVAMTTWLYAKEMPRFGCGKKAPRMQVRMGRFQTWALSVWCAA